MTAAASGLDCRPEMIAARIRHEDQLRLRIQGIGKIAHFREIQVIGE